MISWTTGFIWAQVCNDDCLDSCFRACALINWTVLSQKVTTMVKLSLSMLARRPTFT
jgi:hypothetical protein